MNSICAVCGCTELEVIANARSLDLYEELQSGLYTCCEVAEWADEQVLSWFQALREDSKLVDGTTKPRESEATDWVVVPVRLRQSRVPWFRDPESES